jgi:hypothetical protein
VQHIETAIKIAVPNSTSVKSTLLMPLYTSPAPYLHPTQEGEVGVVASTATLLNTAYLLEFHLSSSSHGTVTAASRMHSSISRRPPSSMAALSTWLTARSRSPNRRVPGEASWRNGGKAGCAYLRSEDDDFLALVPCLRGWEGAIIGRFMAAKSYLATCCIVLSPSYPIL